MSTPISGKLGARLRDLVLKPADPAAAPTDRPRSPAEARAAARSADDKERLIGLLAAPIAAVIALTVISALIAGDPAALLGNGRVDTHHVNPATYHDLLVVLLVLAVGMLLTSLLRKRLYLGILMALYGLAAFNLHYWGFGIPFILCAAWLLVRSYRLQREVTGVGGSREDGPGRRGARAGASPAAAGVEASRRYTPPGR